MPKFSPMQTLAAIRKLQATGAIRPEHVPVLAKTVADARANKAVRGMWVTGSSTQPPEAVMAARGRPLADDLDLLVNANNEHPGSMALNYGKPVHTQVFDRSMGDPGDLDPESFDLPGTNWPRKIAEHSKSRRKYPELNWRRVLGLTPVGTELLLPKEPRQ